MADVRLDLPDRLRETLAVESDLLGFDSTDAYLRWLVENRLSLDADGERGRALTAYGTRLDRTTDERPPSPDAAAEAAERVDGPATNGESDGSVGREARIEDGSVDTAAAALRTVEDERLDVVAQRAVTRTRRRLGAVGTGLDYRSRTTLDGDGRPGEDVADLDEVEVPGYDEATVERRREAVGAAVAYLSDVEEARRSDFVDALYEEFPAGYDSADSWWECIKRGLRQIDRVRPATADTRTWRFLTTPGRVTRISFS